MIRREIASCHSDMFLHRLSFYSVNRLRVDILWVVNNEYKVDIYRRYEDFDWRYSYIGGGLYEVEI